MYLSGTFTIVLVLELAVLESQVQSFTLPRSSIEAHNVRANTTALEKLNKLKNNTKPIEITTTNRTQTVPIQTTAKTEEIKKNVAPTINTKDKPDDHTTHAPSTSASKTNTSSGTSSFSKTTNSSKTPTNSSPVPQVANTSITKGNGNKPGDPLVSAASSTFENNVTTTMKTGNLVTEKNLNSTKKVNVTNQINTTEGVIAKKPNSTENLNNTSPGRSINEANKVNSTNVTEQVNANKANSTENLNNTSPGRSTNGINKVNSTNATERVNANKANSTENLNNTSPGRSTNGTNKVNSKNATERVNAKKANITEKLNDTSPGKSTNGTNKVNSTNATERVNAKKANSTENLKNTSPVRSTNSTNKVNNDTSKKNTMKNVTTNLNFLDNKTISKEIEMKTEENSTTGYSTKLVTINNTINDKNKNNNNDISQNTPNNSNNRMEKHAKPVTKENKSSTHVFTSNSSKDTTLPSWKKYTTIERKRVNTTKDSKNDTVKEQDLLKSATDETRTTMTLKLKGDVNSTKTRTSLEATTQGLNVFTSKRAGYLDFSSRPGNSKETNNTRETVDNKTNKIQEPLNDKTNKIQEVVNNKTNKIEETVNSTQPNAVSETINGTLQTVNGTVSLNNSSPSPRTTPKKLPEQKSMTSQSQLVEDAIQEELMKEEVLFDNVENAKRLLEDRFGARSSTYTPKSESTSSEDKLRVRPISAEKAKNGSLYAVNPNYKPLKKIEVQPSKPFVRDPDDNSWRNESLSSLGIVFKANNSSKPFSQVLKNKTETKLNSLLETNNKDDGPELRTRLEKITEMRKSKKTTLNALGETVYTDYEEPASVEKTNSSNTESKDNSSFSDQIEIKKPATSRGYNFDAVELTTKKNQKQLDDYEDDDDDEDFTLPNIDLKKYFIPTEAPDPRISSMSLGSLASTARPLPTKTYAPDRRPTVQYFPPTEKPQKVNINDYDTIFRQKVNSYTTNIAPIKITIPVAKAPDNEITFDFPKINPEQQNRPNAKRPQQMDKNIYLSQPPQFQRNGINPQEAHSGPGYNEGPYVIKHLRDLIDDVLKADEAPLATVLPLQGVTVSQMPQTAKLPKDYYDYDTHFRKDLISKFVENFNQDSKRFRADFPVLYNTTVVHSKGHPGSDDAESSAFMKRLYDDVKAFQPKYSPRRYDPNCDRTIELSPAYELHYYVPEEEEKQVIELKPNLASRGRL